MTKVVKIQQLSALTRAAVLNLMTTYGEKIQDENLKSSFCASLVKKLRPTSRNLSLRDVALKKFLQTEEDCKLTNRKIRSSLNGNIFYSDGDVIHIAARKIASILGSFSIEEMLNLGRFGPGSTYLCRGTDVSRARKFGLTDVTPEFNKLARGLLAEYPLWASSLTDADEFALVCPMLEVVPGGRYSTVEKDSSTDRSIIVEPTINSWFQQGIGRSIRRRLLAKTGVNLDDQSINQRLAHLGSVSDDLATVDLTNASDLISTKLVEDLLPADWFFWLNITRSHRVKIDDSWHELEKFSSMGNGFTFDLESLIFYALAYAVTATQGYNTFWVNVFGDDIVVPSGVECALKKVFHDVGFQINDKKSFFVGPFRESCGHDYHLGRNIRGIYIKDLSTDFDLMKLHNRMYEWASRNKLCWAKERKFLLSRLSHIKARIPPSLGDLGIHSSFDECCPAVRTDIGWEAMRFDVLLPVLRSAERKDRNVLLDRLQGSDFDRNEIPLRQTVVAYKRSETWVLNPSFCV